MKPDLNSSDLTTSLVGEAMLMELLSRALYKEPDRDWLNQLITEQIFAEVPFGGEQPEVKRGLEILQAWSQANASGLSDQVFSDLKLDYTRLFIGLDMLPTAPWESVYFNRERMVFQEQTLQVRQWFARFGVQVENLNKEPDDHIGLEILFIAHLASLALQAIEKGDQPALDEVLQAQRGFLEEHLLRWGPAWTRLLLQHAQTDFYRGIAHLTHGALLAAADLLDVSMPKEVSI
jgi:TorA maturation chaperone TorD